MIKMIARGYWTALRSGREDDSRWMGNFWVIYCLTLLPLMLGYYSTPARAGAYLAVMLPFAWGLYTSDRCPLRLPGMLFLCPMDEKMRRSYIRKSCLFQVLLNTSLGAAGAVVTWLLGNDGIGTLALTVNIFLLSVICVGPLSGKLSGAGAHGSGGTGRTVVRSVGAGLAILLQIIYADVALSGGMLCQKRWEQVLAGIMQLVFIALAVKYMTCWRPMQEEAICYERARTGEEEAQKYEGRGIR